MELNHIFVFPKYARKGVETRILKGVIRDAKLKRAKEIIVNAVKDEFHARWYYEKNGFEFIKEEATKYTRGSKISMLN